jgi:hypothetical protein
VKLTPRLYKSRDEKFENVMIGLYCDNCLLGHTFKVCLDPLEAICYSCKAVNQIPAVQKKTLTKVTLPSVNLVVPDKDLKLKEKEVEEYLMKVNRDYESADDFRARMDKLSDERWAKVSETAHDGSFETMSLIVPSNLPTNKEY